MSARCRRIASVASNEVKACRATILSCAATAICKAASVAAKASTSSTSSSSLSAGEGESVPRWCTGARRRDCRGLLALARAWLPPAAAALAPHAPPPSADPASRPTTGARRASLLGAPLEELRGRLAPTASGGDAPTSPPSPPLSSAATGGAASRDDEEPEAAPAACGGGETAGVACSSSAPQPSSGGNELLPACALRAGRSRVRVPLAGRNAGDALLGVEVAPAARPRVTAPRWVGPATPAAGCTAASRAGLDDDASDIMINESAGGGSCPCCCDGWAAVAAAAADSLAGGASEPCMATGAAGAQASTTVTCRTAPRAADFLPPLELRLEEEALPVVGATKWSPAGVAVAAVTGDAEIACVVEAD